MNITFGASTKREMNSTILTQVEKSEIYAAVMEIIRANRTRKAREKATIAMEIFTQTHYKSDSAANLKATPGTVHIHGRDIWMQLSTWRKDWDTSVAVLLGHIKAEAFSPYSFRKPAPVITTSQAVPFFPLQHPAA